MGGRFELDRARQSRPIRARTSPASNHSPTGPVLRANPFPEVTDLACRLPLPTLFYQLEAVHLGDLLRIWVQPDTRITLSPSDFQGPTGVHRTPQEPRCFTGTSFPISGRADSRERCGPYKEERTLPGTPADVSEFVCVAALVPLLTCANRGSGTISVSGSGMLTRFPFDRCLACHLSRDIHFTEYLNIATVSEQSSPIS